MMRATPIFEMLACIDDPVPRGAALNMAIDQTLLTGLASTGESTKPILRIYRWREPAVSLGYFDPVQAVRSRFPARPLIRRWTGGGIVEHGDDFTYSLLVPLALCPPGWRAADAYRDIHRALAAALRAAGQDGAFLADDPAKTGAPAFAHVSRECFLKPVAQDVMMAGRKIAGAAQRRTRAGLLHQGSVRLPGADPSSSGSVGPGTALHAALSGLLPGALGRRIEPRPLTASELARAALAAVERYGTADWLEKF